MWWYRTRRTSRWRSPFATAHDARHPEGNDAHPSLVGVSDLVTKRYIRSAVRVIDDGSYAFHSLDQFSDWNSIMGLAFENLVVNNYMELLEPLHMDKALIVSAAPYRRGASAKTGRKGVQIDLLLQTKMSLCVVEIKRKREIGREIIGEISEKCARLARRPNMSLRTALVYDGDIAPSIEADGYINSIVSARRLIGL